jgi:hypothetical protein
LPGFVPIPGDTFTAFIIARVGDSVAGVNQTVTLANIATVATPEDRIGANNTSGPATVRVQGPAPDTAAPLVTPPAAIAVRATEAGGARGTALPELAAFIAGGTAMDAVDPLPTRLPPVISGRILAVTNTTLFPVGRTTVVSFRFRDASGNVGTATSSVTVVP